MNNDTYTRSRFVIKKLRPQDRIISDLICAACKRLFKESDCTALIPLGPGNDKQQQLKAREEGSYDAICVEVHWACATGEEEFVEERKAKEQYRKWLVNQGNE